MCGNAKKLYDIKVLKISVFVKDIKKEMVIEVARIMEDY